METSITYTRRYLMTGEEAKSTELEYLATLESYKQTGNRHAQAICLGTLAEAYYFQREFEKAMACAKEALQYSNDLGATEERI